MFNADVWLRGGEVGKLKAGFEPGIYHNKKREQYQWLAQTPVSESYTDKNKVNPSVADPDPKPDPDPHVFGSPGSGSVSQRNGSRSGSGSGSGSFYHQAKKVRKTLIPTALLLLLTFYR